MANSDSVVGTAALAKGILVLRTIAAEEEPPSLTTLQKKVKLPKGTLHRILQALIAEGLVRRNQRYKTFYLGYGLISLAQEALASLSLREVARDDLIQLRDLTGESVTLVAYDRLDAVVIDRINTKKAVNSFESIGLRSAFYCSASGKAIAAFLPPEDLDYALSQLKLKKLTANTITSKSELRSHFDLVKKQGFATNEGETDLSVFGIASPIFDDRNEVIGSVNLTIPVYRNEPDDRNNNIKAVVETAHRISRRLGSAA